MKVKFPSKIFAFILCTLWIVGFYVGCEKSTDGPLSVSDGDDVYFGDGFFKGASLDSGRTIHLSDDTLYVTLSNIWSFSNCALRTIRLEFRPKDSVLWINPFIKIAVTDRDCAAPYYRPDTTIKVLLKKEDVVGIEKIKVKNDMDSVLDSILLRRGQIQNDTFFIYMDSSFSDPHNLPLRTKGKEALNTPTILRVLDSLTPRVFYWRTMNSTCTHRIDMCNEVVADTIYPSTWKAADTNLVPIHYVCADTDSVYCINSKWENDSTALGKLQERPDTIWHYSTYYMEKIPRCATYASYEKAYYKLGGRVRFIRQLFAPDESEKFCGPSSSPEWMVYDVERNKMFVDSLNLLDSLIAVWKQAKIAPDTLIVDSTASKK